MLPIKTINKSDRFEFWRRQLEDFKKYSGSQNQFCRERGYCPHLLHYWRKKLSGQPRRQPPGLQTISPFIPVTVERVAHLPKSEPSASLPNAKWLAELILHLQERGLRHESSN